MALIGFQNAHIIEHSQATMIAFSSFTSENLHTAGVSALVFGLSLILIVVFSQRKLRGSLLLGMLVAWGIAIVFQLTGVYQVDVEHGYKSVLPDFNIKNQIIQLKDGFNEVFLAAFRVKEWAHSASDVQIGWNVLFSSSFITILLALLFVDFFDTLGTVIAVNNKCNILNRDGNSSSKLRKVFLSDALATFFGSMFGTSTTTTYLESCTGVATGGRTGLTALVAAILFILSLFLAPVFLAMPAFVTGAALVFVGFLMISSISNLDFDDYCESFPAYITTITIPFGYSISEGLALGFISWTIINFTCGHKAKIGWAMYILTALFIVNLLVCK